MIRAVLFDLDDTLYRERDFVEQAFFNVAKAMETRLAGKGRGAARASANTLCAQMIALMEEEGRGKIFDRLLEEYDIELSMAELVKIYRETKPILSLYPDGEACLARLKQARVKTGLITDGNAQVQRNKIRALGLDNRMDVVLASDEIGLSKPDAGVYEYCLERLGCAPEEAAYVGDNPLKDFIGARKIGMKTARIIRPEGMHMGQTAAAGYEADHTVHLLTELAAWLEDK